MSLFGSVLLKVGAESLYRHIALQVNAKMLLKFTIRTP